jgi:hypothetical protein
MKGQHMDEDLFRTYFKKLYKSLVKMETEFLKLIMPSDRSSFLVFSKSVKDIASFYKCEKEVEMPSDTVNLSKRKLTEITTKLIFGVG